MAVHATSVRTIPSAEKEPIAVTKLFSKIGWRILPFLILCYMIAFLDRINIGYAQLQMKQTLTFSDATYGFGAGIFFVGYFLFEVPSNLLLERIGVRKTLLRIMFTWGIVACAMAFVQTPVQFYIARFLLGVLEALGGTYVSSALKDMISYSILIAVILARPQGILGALAVKKV